MGNDFLNVSSVRGNGSQYDFSVVPEIHVPRTAVRRPSKYLTTFSAGKLIPFFWDEVLPGDTFTVDANILARLTTPLVPFMDNLYLDCQFFFVPNRLLWEHWENFCGAKDKPSDTTEYTVPYVTAPAAGVSVGSLADYFGLATGVQWSAHDVQSLPFRAYNLIWNEWYRDENLQDPVTVNVDDNSEDVTSFEVLPRGKRKDYFTGALPWPQKGAAVGISLANAPVVGSGQLGLQDYRLASKQQYKLVSQPGISSSSSVLCQNSSSSSTLYLGVSSDPTLSNLKVSEDASAISLNELRQASALQRLLELDARGGTRYVETLRAHFGVESPDARLQRPELLGSFTEMLATHSVPQQSGTVEGGLTPQGNLSAFSLFYPGQPIRAFSKSFVEHGIIIGLCSVRSDLTYQQGIHRAWSRSTRFDYYWPELASLGEQPILNKEIFLSGSDKVNTAGTLVDNDVFGYQERWSEYKYGRSQITGELRSTYSQTLDYWHLAQKFDELPTLGDAFIRENPPIERVVAVTDAPQFVMSCVFDVDCVRPMPLYCVPGLVNHF